MRPGRVGFCPNSLWTPVIAESPSVACLSLDQRASGSGGATKDQSNTNKPTVKDGRDDSGKQKHPELWPHSDSITTQSACPSQDCSSGITGRNNLVELRMAWIGPAAAALTQECVWSRSRVAAYLLPEVSTCHRAVCTHLNLRAMDGLSNANMKSMVRTLFARGCVRGKYSVPEGKRYVPREVMHDYHGTYILLVVMEKNASLSPGESV